MSTIFSSGLGGSRPRPTASRARSPPARRPGREVRCRDRSPTAPGPSSTDRSPVHVVAQHHVIARPKRQQQRRLGASRSRTRDPAPPSRTARASSNAVRVGLPCGRSPNLGLSDGVLRVGRGLVDRDVDRSVSASGSWPAWIARVSKRCSSLIAPPAAAPATLPQLLDRPVPDAPPSTAWTSASHRGPRRTRSSGELVAGGIAAGARLEERNRRLGPCLHRSGPVGAGREGDRRQDDHALLGVAGREPLAREREQPGRAHRAASMRSGVVSRSVATPCARSTRPRQASSWSPSAADTPPTPPHSREGTPPSPCGAGRRPRTAGNRARPRRRTPRTRPPSRRRSGSSRRARRRGY